MNKWREEFDSLPEWVQKLVRAASSCSCYGSHAPECIGAMSRDKYRGFHIHLTKGAMEKWWEGFLHLKELADAITVPESWEPPGRINGDNINIVELVSDEEQAFDQPCAFGNRCGGHAVYCHNEAWPNAPRKCRRSWYTGGEVRDEDCPGFLRNPHHNPLPSEGSGNG